MPIDATMKITSISAHVLRLPEVTTICEGTQDTCLIHIKTDAGISGWGEGTGEWLVPAVEATLIDWEPLRKMMESQYTPGGPGRPGFPPVLLFKAVLLQQWYNLSDLALKEAIDDRFSFRRFLGLNLDEKVPDHSNVHKFRDRISPIIADLFHQV